jgi:hypothetical protein
MRRTMLWLVLSASTLLSACAGREILYVRGCDERLSMPYKRQECRACVERPIPHEYLPDRPDGVRCVRR